MARIEDAFAVQPSRLHSPCLTVSQAHSVKPSDGGETSCQTVPTTMSDEAHEREIVREGLAVERHMRLRDEGCMGAAGEADRQLDLASKAAARQGDLIRGRSEAQVDRMLAAQAVRMALEPGATKQ